MPPIQCTLVGYSLLICTYLSFPWEHQVTVFSLVGVVKNEAEILIQSYLLISSVSPITDVLKTSNISNYLSFKWKVLWITVSADRSITESYINRALYH